MESVAEIARSPLDLQVAAGAAELAVAASVEASRQLGVDPTVAAQATAELEEVFGCGATVSSNLIPRGCKRMDTGDGCDSHVYI